MLHILYTAEEINLTQNTEHKTTKSNVASVLCFVCFGCDLFFFLGCDLCLPGAYLSGGVLFESRWYDRSSPSSVRHRPPRELATNR